MVFGQSNVLILSLLAVLFSSLTVSGEDTIIFHDEPAEAPHYFHHHHHHHHSPTVSPVASPIYPPTKSPVHRPATPPVKPPVHPPVNPPVHPPVKPPVYPPVKPPVTPPVKPPVKPPVYPPVKPPVSPPVKPPVHPPVSPPVKPPVSPPVYRKLVAIRGVVFCKSCKYRGYETLKGASPLAGAIVKLECNNTKYPLREETKTDKNGFFFFMPLKLTTAGTHKCKVTLVSSPLKKCGVPTNLHGGAAGAMLVPSPQKPTDSKLEIFTVGPFAFESDKKFTCHT